MAWISLADDLFSRADNADLGASWDAGYHTYTSLSIVSNTVRASVATTNESDETYALSLPPNQWGEVSIPTWTAGANAQYAWVMLRSPSPATATWAQATIARNDGGFTTRISYKSAGAETSVASENSTTWAANDVLRFEAIDSTFRVYRNGTLLLSGTDSTITGAGRAGLGIYVASSTTQVGLSTFRCGRIGTHLSLNGVGS